MNLDEAAAASGMRAEGSDPEKLVAAVVTSLSRLSAHTQLSITAGSRGSWAWDGAALTHTPAFRARVVSTAGAGDAHLAGTLVGLTAGLTLPEAQELGALVAGLSITSPHTIDKEIGRESLHRFTMTLDAPVSNTVEELLQGTGAPWSEKENHR